MIVLIYAHPYPSESHINKALLHTLTDLTPLQIHTLYNTYPDFDIDISAEQQRLKNAEAIIIQYPVLWYSMPALLKLWFDKVFEYHWVYAEHGHALKGKKMLCVTTANHTTTNSHHTDQAEITMLNQPLHNTARYCGMQWLPPFSINGALHLSNERLTQVANAYRQHLIKYCFPQFSHLSSQ